MGGKSTGKFTVAESIGTMEGTVAIVPSLSAPGFINAQALASYADVSSCSGIELDIRVTSDPAYEGWRFSFGNDFSKCGQFFARGYHASFTPPQDGNFGKVQIPFDEFTRCWSDSTGEPIKTCTEHDSVCPTTKRLANLQSLQVWAEGKEGDVKIDMRSVSAYGCGAAALTESTASIPLTTFDGADATTQRWFAMNDPVMGGKSKATFAIENEAAVFDGAVAIVPSLQAPGFCTMEHSRITFPDISDADALQVVARQTSNYQGWRFTIGDAPRNPDSGAPFFVKGQYKANAAIPVSDEFQTVTIPFTDFTYKWSDTTGEPTVKCVDDASVCPDAEHLKAPKQLAITAEGLEGSFHLEVKSITAVNTASMQGAVVV